MSVQSLALAKQSQREKIQKEVNDYLANGGEFHEEESLPPEFEKHYRYYDRKKPSNYYIEEESY